MKCLPFPKIKFSLEVVSKTHTLSFCMQSAREQLQWIRMFRGVFRTLSNIYDGAFLLIPVNDFLPSQQTTVLRKRLCLS